MAAPTPKLGLRVLEPSDAADVPADLNQVTGILDNAVIDAGQGGHGGLPAAGTQGRTYWKNDRLHLMRDNGAQWDIVGQGPIPIVTSLPGAPYDGQEVRLEVKSLQAGAQRSLWHLRYNQSAAAGRRWEYVAGGPLKSRQGAQAVSIGDHWYYVYDAGDEWVMESITIPAAGLYDITCVGDVWTDAVGAGIEFRIEVESTVIVQWSCEPGVRPNPTMMRRMNISLPSGAAGGYRVKWRRYTGSGNINAGNLSISITPVAIGG